MASDCTVPIDNGYINLRVGAIIIKNGKFLKNIPEIIYYHGEDDTWIASGNE